MSAEKHTPLPWALDEGVGELWIAGKDRCRSVCMITAAGEITERDLADAELIVTAVNERPTLLAQYEAMRKSLEAIVGAARGQHATRHDIALLAESALSTPAPTRSRHDANHMA